MKTVEYLGESWQVEDGAKFIAADYDGGVYSYRAKPVLNDSGAYYSVSLSDTPVYLGCLERNYYAQEILTSYR